MPGKRLFQGERAAGGFGAVSDNEGREGEREWFTGLPRYGGRSAGKRSMARGGASPGDLPSPGPERGHGPAERFRSGADGGPPDLFESPPRRTKGMAALPPVKSAQMHPGPFPRRFRPCPPPSTCGRFPPIGGPGQYRLPMPCGPKGSGPWAGRKLPVVPSGVYRRQ